MAGTRFHKIGTIFSRTTGLLKSGAMKPQDKPLWYDVYEAFPPKVEPCYNRVEPTGEIMDIFYEEDMIRAKFYKNYSNIGIMNMFETNDQKSICQLFVDEFLKRKNTTDLSDDQLFTEVIAHLENQGINLTKKKTREVSKDEELLNQPFKLSEIFSDSKEKNQ